MMKMISLSTAKLKSTILDLTEITKVQKEIDDAHDLVSFEEILVDIQENLFSLVEESGAVITADFAVEQIEYARKNLRSILYNLVANAIKYRSPERPPRIVIQTRQLPHYVLLTVEDNGLGIASHQQHKLFTMFQRLHTHVEGTGIGLYIIKRIIENNGGRIEVDSEEGKGTTFHVFFKEK
jgi:signal transduction histidine kinase